MKQKFIEICENASLVGTSCLIYNKGKIVNKLNYGFSSLEKKKKVNNDTVFRIASISKVIVALCIMRLYEEGKLDFNEDVSTYMGFEVRNPKYKDVPINLKMIMTQTSSITDGFEEGINSDYNSGYNKINGTNKTFNDLICEFSYILFNVQNLNTEMPSLYKECSETLNGFDFKLNKIDLSNLPSENKLNIKGIEPNDIENAYLGAYGINFVVFNEPTDIILKIKDYLSYRVF